MALDFPLSTRSQPTCTIITGFRGIQTSAFRIGGTRLRNVNGNVRCDGQRRQLGRLD
jgi:hypothetical protein